MLERFFSVPQAIVGTRCEHPPDIEMSFEIIGVNADNFGEINNRFVVLVLPSVDTSTIKVCASGCGIEVNGLCEIRNGLIVIPL